MRADRRGRPPIFRSFWRAFNGSQTGRVGEAKIEEPPGKAISMLTGRIVQENIRFLPGRSRVGPIANPTERGRI